MHENPLSWAPGKHLHMLKSQIDNPSMELIHCCVNVQEPPMGLSAVIQFSILIVLSMKYINFLNFVKKIKKKKTWLSRFSKSIIPGRTVFSSQKSKDNWSVGKIWKYYPVEILSFENICNEWWRRGKNWEKSVMLIIIIII